MEQSNRYYSPTGYDPVNEPIMDPEYQLPATTSEFGPQTVAPLAMLGLGLAGAAAYVLSRRKKPPTLQERLLGMLEDSYEHGRELASDIYGDVADFTHDEVKPRAEAARKKGFKLFKRGSKAAEKAFHEASDFAEEEAKHAAKTGSKLFKRGSKMADKAFEQAQHYARHEGDDLRKQALKTSKKLAKDSQKAAKQGRNLVLDTYENMADRYPLLTGLLLAALVSEGQKLLESYRTREA